MIKRYFGIGFRNIRNKKFHSFINISSLSVSLTVFILITLWLQNQLSYDRYNTNAKRIYRLTTSIKDANGTLNMAMTAPPVAEAVSQLPEVESAVRLLSAGKNVTVSSRDKIFNEPYCFFADSTLFGIFTLPFVAGDSATALKNPYTVVLSAATAKKCFGTENAVGKTLKVNWHNSDHEYLVTGVMADMPQNSHFHMDMVASLNSVGSPALSSSWNSVQVYAYILLKSNSSIHTLNTMLPEIIRRHMAPDLAGFWSLRTESLASIHLHSHLLLEMQPNGNVYNLYMFGTAALLLLVIAMINFISLSTVRFRELIKAAGLRRMLGATRSSLILQLLFENLLLVVGAVVIAISVTEIVIPAFQNLTGVSIRLTTGSVLVLLVSTAAVCLPGILLPAIMISSVPPAAILNKRVSYHWGGVGIRRTLIVMQFSIAMALLVSALVINDQMHFVSAKDLGINIGNTILVPLPHRALQSNHKVIKNQFLRLQGVKGVTATSGDPTNSDAINALFYDGKSALRVRSLAVDYDFLETMGVHLLSGRDFSRSIPADSTDAIIVNETAEKKLAAMRLASQPLQFRSTKLERKRSLVIGVVRNFNYRPLYYPVEPLVLYVHPAAFRCLEVVIGPHNKAGTLKNLRQTWSRLEPDYPFDFTFLDQDLAHVYGSYRKTGILFDAFSLLAVFVSGLGVLGLAYHSAEMRTKEIGIRKVLGSSASRIVLLLTKESMATIFIAGVLGFPFAWWFLNGWLEDFAFHVGISPATFVEALLLVAGMALAITGSLAAKAATANPIEALRYE